MRKNKIYSSLRTLEIPAELLDGEPVIQIQGFHKIIVENYKCILKCCCEEILLRTPAGNVRIHGRGLKIVTYTPYEMTVEGSIQAICNEGR